MKTRKKSKLEMLSRQDVELITRKAESRKGVPLVKSSQVNMRLDPESLHKIQMIAKRQGLPYTTFLTKLVVEDIERLWSVFS